MKKHLLAVLAALVLAVMVPWAMAQDQSAGSDKDKKATDQTTQSAPEGEEGIESGGYNIRQVIEVGGRIADHHGSTESFNTFVNMYGGPRLLEYSLDMRALSGEGMLFDRLSTSSFGYGGDGVDASRLRMSKHKYYDFAATFRRDKNYWDYNLFANPYNPQPNFIPPLATWPSDVVQPVSMHTFQLVRRMTDLGVTLAPQSKISLRLGYGRVTMEGPSLSSLHGAVDTVLNTPWHMTTDTARAGIDFKFIPRTRISYDQFFNWYNNTTSWADTNLLYQVQTLALPVDAGLVFDNSGTGTPCGTGVNSPFNNGTTPATLIGTCNGYIAYTRTANQHAQFPTEQLSIHSNLIRNVDIDLRGGYNDAFLNSPYNEQWYGRTSRTNGQRSVVTGPTHGRRITTYFDAGVTVHVTDKIRISDLFYYNAFREPTTYNQSQAVQFSASMATAAIVPGAGCTLATLAGCPVHSNSSGPDFGNEIFSNFFGVKQHNNLIEADFDLNQHFGFRVGYRFRSQNNVVRAGEVVPSEIYYPGPAAGNANRSTCTAALAAGFAVIDPVTGICTVTNYDMGTEEEVFDIAYHSFLGGVWFRPTENLKINFDVEHISADHPFTRLSPGSWTEFKGRVSYKPSQKFSFGVAMDVIQSSNNTAEAAAPSTIGHDEHNRTFGFQTSYFPADWISLDLSYDYNNLRSQTNTCVVSSVVTPTGWALNKPYCNPTSGGSYLEGPSVFENRTHSGNFNLMLKPVRRVMLLLGYTVTSSAAEGTGIVNVPLFPGSATTVPTYGLNPYAPVGALGSNYHLPNILLAIDLTKRWTFKAGWNYYGYNEKSPAGWTTPRDFAGNVETISLRYAF